MRVFTTTACLVMAFAVVYGASLKNQNTGFKVVEHKQHRHAMEQLEPDLAATIFHGIQRNPLERTTTVKPVMFPKSPTMRGKRSASHEAAVSAIHDFTSIDRVVFLGNDDPLHEDYDTLAADFDLDAKPFHVDKPDGEVSFSVTAPAVLDELEEIGETSILPSEVTRKVIDEEPAVVTGAISDAPDATTAASTTEENTTSANEIEESATTTEEIGTDEVANTTEAVLSTSDGDVVEATTNESTTTTPIIETTLIQEVVESTSDSTTPWPQVVVIEDSTDAKPSTEASTTTKPIGVTVPSFDLSEDDDSETEKHEAVIPPRAQPIRQEVQETSDNIAKTRLTPNRPILDSSVMRRRNIVSNDLPPSAFEKFFRRRQLLRAQQANEFFFRQAAAARRVKRAAEEYEDYDTVSTTTPKATTASESGWNTDATRPTDAPLKLVPKETASTTTEAPTTQTIEEPDTDASERPLTAAQKLALLEAAAPQRKGLITGKTGRSDGQIRTQTTENGRIQIKFVDNERPVVPDRSYIRITPNLVPKKPAPPLRDTPTTEKPIIANKPVRVVPTKTARPTVPAPTAPVRQVAPQFQFQRFQQPQPQLVFPQGPHYPPVQVWQQPPLRNPHPQLIQRPAFPPILIDPHRPQVSILPVPTPRPTTRRPVIRNNAVHSGDVVKEVGPRVQQQELNIVRIYQHYGTTKQAFVRPETTPVPTTTEKPTTTTQRPKWVGVTFTTHPTPTTPFDDSLVSTPSPKANSHIRTAEFDLYDEVNAETEPTTTTTTTTTTASTSTSLTTTPTPSTTTEESIAPPQSAEKFVHKETVEATETFPEPNTFDYITDEEAASEKVPKPAKQQPKLVKFADSEDVKAFPARDFTGDAPEAHPDLRGFGDKVITSVGLS